MSVWFWVLAPIGTLLILLAIASFSTAISVNKHLAKDRRDDVIAGSAMLLLAVWCFIIAAVKG